MHFRQGLDDELFCARTAAHAARPCCGFYGPLRCTCRRLRAVALFSTGTELSAPSMLPFATDYTPAFAPTPPLMNRS